MHIATKLGLKNDKYYQAAYWKAFEEFFGPTNGPVIKAMLIAKNDHPDTGTTELDRVCYGLRQTMSWLAEAIERKAIQSVGGEVSANRASPAHPEPPSRKRRKASS